MRTDDDSLLQSLYEGMFETPLWRGFLNKLLAKTGSDAVKLLFQPSDEERIIELSAGNAIVLEESMLPEGGRRIGDVIAFRSMRPNRVYAQDELLELAETRRVDIPPLANNPEPFKQLRAIRVTEPGGLDLWLLCSGGKNIGSATSALLTALAPHLQIALRSHAALERERFRSSITGQAFDRLKMGWLSLDTGCVWGGCLSAVRLRKAGGGKKPAQELIQVECEQAQKPA